MRILLFDMTHPVSDLTAEESEFVYAVKLSGKTGGQAALYQYIKGESPKVLTTFEINDAGESLTSWLQENQFEFDVVINNLEQINGTKLSETSVEEWNESLYINLHVPFMLMQAVTPFIKDGGQFIHLSSTAAVSGENADVSYAAQKSALESLSKSLSRQLLSRNIRSNVISVSQKYFHEAADIKQVSGLIIQMCSVPVSFLNGQVITLDNGETLS
ncbi:SDR family oxidoreductase [Corticicoccus populi]|uniref:SDR family oxidoreductase n=1 Tax=Corticicoccus populi TaxID=1812821 RepID=A0ABW5WU84_9STAP